MTESTPWTPERESQLADLWAKGIATRLIGEKMGLTKSAVVGKARRMNLPIRRRHYTKSAREIKARKIARRDALRPWSGDLNQRANFKLCQWIDGEPADQRFCHEPSKPGKSWCEEHYKRVYTGIKPKPTDHDRIIYLFLDKKMSKKAIAEEVGCDRKTVRRVLDKNGIER